MAPVKRNRHTQTSSSPNPFSSRGEGAGGMRSFVIVLVITVVILFFTQRRHFVHCSNESASRSTSSPPWCPIQTEWDGWRGRHGF